MKKSLLIVIFVSFFMTPVLYGSVQELEAVLEKIKTAADVNTLFGSENYYKQRIEVIYDLCLEADPSLSKPQKLQTVGYALLVGAGIAGTLAVQGSWHILTSNYVKP